MIHLMSYGMEVNFGTLAQGNGKVQPKKSVQTVEQAVDPPQEVVEKEVTPPKEEIPEPIKEVLTEKESTVAVPEKKKGKKDSTANNKTRT